MITVKLQRTSTNITVETSNQRSMLAATARSAQPRNYIDLPPIISAICVTHWTRTKAGGWGGAQIYMWFHTSKTSVILQNTLKLSLLQQCIKIFLCVSFGFF